MKALVKRERKPGLWLDEVPAADVGINDVLIHVDRTGICGTDLHIYKWDEWAQRTIPVPMVVGHCLRSAFQNIRSASSPRPGHQPRFDKRFRVSDRGREGYALPLATLRAKLTLHLLGMQTLLYPARPLEGPNQSQRVPRAGPVGKKKLLLSA